MSKLRVSYQTHEFGEIDIHLRTLRNNQEYFDEHGIAEKLGISSASWSLFGVVWPSSLVLAHHLNEKDVSNKRILEVGCGIGLTSLLLNHRNEDITATDYHPEVQAFLNKNAQLNDDEPIPFVRTGWADEISDLGQFDLVVGSDLLYEDEHVDLLADFIAQHCKPQSEVIVVDPGRKRGARFTRKMKLHGFEHTQSKPTELKYLEKPFSGTILSYTRVSGA